MTDENDNSPSIVISALSPVEGRARTPEAAAVGSFVAHVIVSDDDAGASGRVTCHLEGQDSNLFRLQSVSAVQVNFLAIPLRCCHYRRPKTETRNVHKRFYNADDFSDEPNFNIMCSLTLRIKIYSLAEV